MADEAQVLEQAKKLPLDEQLGHSSWKVRAQALATIQERVGRAFSCEDEIFAQAGEACGQQGHGSAGSMHAVLGQAAGSLQAVGCILPPAPLPLLLAACLVVLPRTAHPRWWLSPFMASPAGPLLAKAVGDSNANVMDKAVETLVAYLEKADEGLAARWVGEVGGCVRGWKGTLAAQASGSKQ